MTAWFEKEVGDKELRSLDVPGMSLIDFSGGKPDRVRLPKELGGAEVRVLTVGWGQCPKCGKTDVPMYTLERGFSVYECSLCQFVWIGGDE